MDGHMSCIDCLLLQQSLSHKNTLTLQKRSYDTTGSIKTVALAWQEWNCGPGEATIADRVTFVKANKSLAVGARNSSLHKKNRHLPQLVEILIRSGATAEESVRLMTQIANQFDLTLDQMREGARLLNGKTAKPDCDTLTAETNVTVGHFRQAIAWARGEVHAAQQRQSVVANKAEAYGQVDS